MKIPFVNPTGAPMSSAKKRQLMTAATIFSIVVLGSYGMIAFTDHNSETATSVEPPKQIDKVDLSKPDQSLSGPAVWQATEGAKTDLNAQKIEELLKWKEQQEASKLEPLGSSNEMPNLQANLPPAPPTNGIKAGAGIPVDGGPNAAPSSLIKSIELSRASGRTLNVGNGTAQGSTLPNSKNVIEVDGIRPNYLVRSDGGNVDYLYGAGSGSNNSTGRFKAQKSYIPSGTFFRAKLLGGMDAPTGGESSAASPYPILMRVTNMAQLPNRFRENFKDCFITGTGYGDLSSERAIVRTEQLSCVGYDGRAIDISIKGYVAGEDGKAGIRGRLVSKQGAVLKNALLTGILGGVGQTFSTAASSVTSTASGVVSTIPDSKLLQAGVGAGVGSAMDKLAQYYIKLADKMFPVIEVDAGRIVDVVLLKGFQIDGSE